MSSGPWSCPTCLRSVPPRVNECYCGTTREAAERAALAAEPAPGSGRPWIPAVLVAVALAVLVVALRGGAPVPPETPAPPVTTAYGGPPTTRPPPYTPYPESARRLTQPYSAPATPVAPPPSATPAPPAPAAAAPPAPVEADEPDAPADDGIAARRAEAEQALDQALARVAGRRDALEARMRAWDASCGASTSAVRPAGCGLLQRDIRELVGEIEQGLADGDREARRGWVTPGARRDLKARYELDGAAWTRLRSRAQAALR